MVIAEAGVCAAARDRARGCCIVLDREMLQEQTSLYPDFSGLPPGTTGTRTSREEAR